MAHPPLSTPHAALSLIALAALTARADDRLTEHAKPKPLPPGATTEDWPRYLGPHDNATTAEDTLLDTWPEGGPTLLWELARGEGYAAPTIAGGRLFSFDRDPLAQRERLECRDPETGALRWEFGYPVEYRDRYGFADGPRASPVLDGELVFLAGVTGQLRAIDAATGKEVWHRDLQEDYAHRLGFFGYGPAPVVHNDLLLVNVGGTGEADGKGVCVAAFDKRSGEERWRYLDTWGASYASPVLGKLRGRDTLLVFAGGESRPPHGGLLVLDPATGERFDRIPWRADKYESVNASPPLIVGEDSVFLSECYAKGGAMLRFDEELKATPAWEERWFGMHWSLPLLIDGHLYGFAGRNKPDVQFKCARARDGEILWEDDMRYEHEVGGRAMTLSFFRGSLLRAGGDRVFALGEDGVFAELELSPEGVETKQRSQLILAEQSWALPVIHRGLLYLCQNGRGATDASRARILCYDLRAPTPTDE